MENTERIDILMDAQEKINEAVELIRDAVRGSGEANRVDAYLIPALEMAASSQHGWLGSNPCSIDKVIETLSEDEGDDDDSEY